MHDISLWREGSAYQTSPAHHNTASCVHYGCYTTFPVTALHSFSKIGTHHSRSVRYPFLLFVVGPIHSDDRALGPGFECTGLHEATAGVNAPGMETLEKGHLMHLSVGIQIYQKADSQCREAARLEILPTTHLREGAESIQIHRKDPPHRWNKCYVEKVAVRVGVVPAQNCHLEDETAGPQGDQTHPGLLTRGF